MIVSIPSTEIGTRGGRARASAHASHYAFSPGKRVPECAACGPGRARRGSGSRGQAGRETPDPVAEVGYRRVEAGVITGRDRVRDGPVHGGLAAEFLAGHVADRDYEVAVVLDLADVT